VSSGADDFRGRFDSLRQAQKKRRGVPLYTLYVNRPAGRVIAAASPAWMTPNGLTAIGGVLTYGALIALMFFVDGGPASALVGVALVLGFFFDSADGQLARLRSAGSVSGEWLDHVLDSGRIVLLHIATLWFLVRTEALDETLAVLVCTAFALAATLVFFAGTLFEKLEALHGEKPASPADPASPPPATARTTLRSALMLPVDYGVTCAMFLLLPWSVVFVPVYVVLAVIKVLSTSAFLAKWYLALRRIDARRRRVAMPSANARDAS
jgi:phosphatidylglycerophosphate synthase